VALLTYRSARREADASWQLHTHRSSIWMEEGGAWRLRYHQGTPAAQAW